MASENPGFRELKEGASLQELFAFADGLTRERNGRNFKTLADRVDHLALGAGEMLKTIQVEDTEVVPIVAAKMILRIRTVVQGLGSEDAFLQTLMGKFPEAGCSYCGKKPCQCVADRPQKTANLQPSEAQKSWSLKDWQEHLMAVYGTSNHENGGLIWAASRLSSEVREVLEARMRMDREDSEEGRGKYRDEVLRELADSFAWIIGVCNEMGADIESVFVERYGKGCPHCGKYPCECGEFEWVDERKDERGVSDVL